MTLETSFKISRSWLLSLPVESRNHSALVLLSS
nr:MAG TPA: hypothetical protein [Crassvirales sp.]